jgi:hypothetical protein
VERRGAELGDADSDGYSLFREGATNAAGKEPIEALINL